IITSMASRMASIIVIRAMALHPRLLALAAQMRRHLGIDALEDVPRGRLRTGMERAEALRFLLGGDHRIEDLGLGLFVPFLRPDALHDKVVLQADDRIPERPGIGFRLR